MKVNKIIFFNLLLFAFLFLCFYFSAFLLGYASNINYLGSEKRLYLIFCGVHLLFNLIAFRMGVVSGWKGLVILICTTVLLYAIAYLTFYVYY